MKSCRFAPLFLGLVAIITMQTARAQPPVAAPAAAPVDPSKDVPGSSWVYGAAASLSESFSRLPYYGAHGGHLRVGSMTRYEFAVMVARLLDKLPPTRKVEPYKVVSPTSLNIKDLIILQRLNDEFARELQTLGVDMAEANERINAARGIAPPFSDLPAEHWAASSVEVVRKAGILVGYPFGTFHGSW